MANSLAQHGARVALKTKLKRAEPREIKETSKNRLSRRIGSRRGGAFAPGAYARPVATPLRVGARARGM